MIKIVNTSRNEIARSFSFGPIKRIMLGTRYVKLTDDQRIAVLLHETAHCERHHTEWRIIFLLMPFMFKWVCQKQELAADRYVAEQGYAQPLIEVLAKEHDGGRFHPSNAMRRGHLKLHDQSRFIPDTDNNSPGLA